MNFEGIEESFDTLVARAIESWQAEKAAEPTPLAGGGRAAPPSLLGGRPALPGVPVAHASVGDEPVDDLVEILVEQRPVDPVLHLGEEVGLLQRVSGRRRAARAKIPIRTPGG